MSIELQNANVLVIGGAGFIGSHILEELLMEGAYPIIFDDFSRGSPDVLVDIKGDFEIIKGDIRNYDEINSAIKKCDYIFHEAAVCVRRCLKNPELSIDVNIKGSFNVFKSALNNKIQKLVFASSASVYGDTVYTPIDENHPKDPMSYYCSSKFACEHYLHVFGRAGLKNVAFRYMNVYGPRQTVDAFYTSVIISFLNNVKNNKSPIIHGDGSQTFDFVNVKDVARANILALKSDLTQEVYNLGGDCVVTIKELAEKILEITGSDLQPEYQPEKLVLIKKRIGSSEKLKKELGYKPIVPFDVGIKEVVDDFNKRPDFYLNRCVSKIPNEMMKVNM